jgi:hypothetical protein
MSGPLMPPAKNARIAANKAERQHIIDNPIDLSMAKTARKNAEQ